VRQLVASDHWLEAGLRIGLQHTSKAGQVRLRMFSLVVVRVRKPHGGYIRSTCAAGRCSMRPARWRFRSRMSNKR
jgi:hypothetical protein